MYSNTFNFNRQAINGLHKIYMQWTVSHHFQFALNLPEQIISGFPVIPEKVLSVINIAVYCFKAQQDVKLRFHSKY